MREKRLPACPKTLGAHGRRFWRNVVSVWKLSPEELQILEGVAMNLDQFFHCQDVIGREGFIMSSQRGNKVRPEVSSMKDSWRSFLVGCKFLKIDRDVEDNKPTWAKKPGRPVEDRWARAYGTANE